MMDRHKFGLEAGAREVDCLHEPNTQRILGADVRRWIVLAAEPTDLLIDTVVRLVQSHIVVRTELATAQIEDGKPQRYFQIDGHNDVPAAIDVRAVHRRVQGTCEDAAVVEESSTTSWTWRFDSV